jgi:hypothetical protein
MFRTMPGFKAQYDDLTLLVIAEFNEWKVMLRGPGMIIQGTHQFSEAKAKEHALAVARSYVTDQKHQEPPTAEEPWTPITEGDWLIWRS